MVETNLPILYLREVVLFPGNEARLEFTSDEEKKILSYSQNNYDGHILFINLIDPLEEAPLISELPKIGILGKIKSRIDLPNNITRVVITTIDRVEILNYIETSDIMSSFVIPIEDYNYDEIEVIALRRVLERKLKEYINTSSYMSNTVLGRISGVNNINRLSDIITSELPLEYKEAIKYISITNPITRIKNIIEYLSKEIEALTLENKIEETLKNRLEEEQKEYMLKEKIRLIKEELGEVDPAFTNVE